MDLGGEQDSRGVCGCGVYLSLQIHQKYTFRCRSACRTPPERGQEYLTIGKQYIEPCKNSRSNPEFVVGALTPRPQTTRELTLRLRLSEVAQSCPTLCDPMDCSLPGFSVHGIFQTSTGVGCHFMRTHTEETT